MTSTNRFGTCVALSGVLLLFAGGCLDRASPQGIDSGQGTGSVQDERLRRFAQQEALAKTYFNQAHSNVDRIVEEETTVWKTVDPIPPTLPQPQKQMLIFYPKKEKNNPNDP